MANWDGNEGSERDERFLKLAAGANRVRILDDGPVFKFVHWVDNRPLTCPGYDGDCPMCKANKAARTAWGGDPKEFKPPYRNQKSGMSNVLIYGANPEVKILTFGQKIGDQFKALDKSEDWGDLRDFDVEINKSGTGFGTTYTVTPKQKKALTAEQQGIADNGKHNLEAEAVPVSAEKLKSIMASAGADSGDSDAAGSATPERGVNDKASPLQIKLLEKKIKEQGPSLDFSDFGLDRNNLTVGQVNEFIRQLSQG